MLKKQYKLIGRKQGIPFVICIVLFIGILFSTAGTAMIYSGSFNLNNFYDVGEVYDVLEYSRNSDGVNLDYSGTDNLYTITENGAAKIFSLDQMQRNWRYIYMEISDISAVKLYVKLNYYDNSGNLIYQKPGEFKEGLNLLDSDGAVYSMLSIQFFDQKGATFSIDKVQFRETIQTASKGELLCWWLGLFAAFLLTALLIYKIYNLQRKYIKWDWYRMVDGLQGLYLKIGRIAPIPFSESTGKNRGLIRSILFSVIFLYMQISYVTGRYESNQYYRYQMLICSAILIIIALSCKEKKLVRLNWRNRLVGAWITLWIIAVISDLLVDKRYAYTGYQMIFVVGFLFFMWGNMEYREQLVWDFIRAIEWTFLINVVFCYLFRPATADVRYCGGYYNPNMFGIFLLFVLVALIGKLEWCIQENRAKRKRLFLVGELAVAASLLWITQSTTEIGIAAIVTGIYGLYHILFRRHRQSVALVLCMFLVFAGSYGLSTWGIYNIPQKVDHEIHFEKDVYLATVSEDIFTMQVQAAGMEENRIITKLQSTSLESFTSGRSAYWKGYLRKMNLWGHENKAYLWGDNRLPHNGMIAIMYRYGIIAGVPYAVMLIYNLSYGIRSCKREENHNCSCYLLLVTVSGILLILDENMEIPFAWLCWFSMYLMMGYHFMQDNNDKKEMGLLEDV